MKTFRVKAIAREFFTTTIEADTEEEAWEKAKEIPYDEWGKDEDATFFHTDDYCFEITNVEEE